MLAEQVPDLALFFSHCLVSSDAMAEHVIREHRPLTSGPVNGRPSSCPTRSTYWAAA